MKRIKQTILDAVNGNCWHACVASVLDLELCEVPAFPSTHPDEDTGGSWFTPWEHWFAAHDIGWFYYQFECWPERNTKFRLADGTICILTGKSPRFDVNHAVVAKYEHTQNEWGFQMYHDPHPYATEDLYIKPPFVDIYVLWRLH